MFLSKRSKSPYLAVFEPELTFENGVAVLRRYIEGSPADKAVYSDCSAVYRGWSKAKRIPGFSRIEDLGVLEDVVSFEFCFKISGLFAVPEVSGRVFISGKASNEKFLLIRLESERDDGWLDGIVESLSSIAPLTYGYIDYWKGETDAFLHALGISAGYPSSPAQISQAEMDEKWFTERVLGHGPAKLRRFRDCGMLRDVYPVNLLNRKHLEFKVNGSDESSLLKRMERRDWGKLVQLSSADWRWELAPQEIESVRTQLAFEKQLIVR